MRLASVRIQNFRSFSDETIHFDPYTCLVGPNGAGKSTILTALNVFFRNSASAATNVVHLSEQDFHHNDTAQPIVITLTFKDLSEEAKEDLGHYVRQSQLIVSAKAVWNEAAKSAEVKQYGSRNVMKPFAPYFKAAEGGEKAAKLKEIYDELQEKYELPKATSAATRAAELHKYEEAHPELCESLEGETQFYGFTKGSNLLRKYIQWVFVPAVKDASTEQEEGTKGALKELLDRTVRGKVNFKEPIDELKKQCEKGYRKIIDDNRGALESLEASIQARLKEWASPGALLRLAWQYDDNKSVVVNEPYARAAIGEDNFIGEVARLGHGMQRSFLVSILHELAVIDSEVGPTLLLGFEEPELYQHPPQAQHMSNLLEDLAHRKECNTQILVSTHSPYFVSTKGFENVRVVRKHYVDKCSLVAGTTYEKVERLLAKALNAKPDLPSVTMATIEQIMQPSQKELFFTRVAVLVEGPEDIGFIATHMVLSGQWLDFRRLGCHFIVTGGKTNMSRPLAIARELCIRAFAVIDADTDKNNVEEQKRDNACILNLCCIEKFNPMPKDNLYFDNCVIWSTRIADVIKAEVGEEAWQAACNSVRRNKGFLHGSSNKNKMFIAGIVEELYAKDFVSPSLAELCSRILAFAERSITDVEYYELKLEEVPDGKLAAPSSA